jgi:hypothetical protein
LASLVDDASAGLGACGVVVVDARNPSRPSWSLCCREGFGEAWPRGHRMAVPGFCRGVCRVGLCGGGAAAVVSVVCGADAVLVGVSPFGACR